MLMGHGVLNLLGAALLIGFAPVRRYSPMPPEPDPTIPLNCGTEETAVYIDRHRRELGAWSPESFAKVREALLAYRFYPAKTMIRKTQFEEENRAARIGDRLGLGLLPPNLPGLHPVSLSAVVEINVLVDEPGMVELGYTTTRKHYGRGEWVAEVRREGGKMILEVRCHIRPTRWFVWCGLPLYRYFQLQAFHSGFNHLLSLTQAEPGNSPASNGVVS